MQFDERVAVEVRIGHIAKPECHFIEIGCKMLCRNFVPRYDDSQLEQGKRRFDPICRNIPLL
jgi:hypothetical protein